MATVGAGLDVYSGLNKHWKTTTKILFGAELGELKDYEQWLAEYIRPPTSAKSSVSGKPTVLTTQNYNQNASFASFDEVDFSRKFEPLNINEIKDIDSIVAAVQERLYYTGNIVLGNSSNVDRSSNVVDSHFVYGSNVVSDSKYIGFSSEARHSEHCFGCYVAAQSSYIIKSGGGWQTRCFECHICQNTSDCYYATGLIDCRNCMFSFGVRGGSYLLGNLQLQRDKYSELKKKLLAEIVEMLKSGKRAYSLFEVIATAQKYGRSSLKPAPREEKFTLEPIEEAFANTSSVVLGKGLHGIDEYSAFLKKNVPQNAFTQSQLSGMRVAIGSHLAHLLGIYDIKDRMLDDREIAEVGKTSIDAAGAENLKFDLESVSRALAPVAYGGLDSVMGNVSNTRDVTITIDCMDCYNGSAFVQSKKCAYCHWPRESECIFGSSVALKSSFCIKCFCSANIARAFEVDNCENCADIYFSHNCENVRDSMFCFNTKNLNHAIGNAPIAQDKYGGVKKAILEQLGTQLESKKDIPWSVFSIVRNRTPK